MAYATKYVAHFQSVGNITTTVQLQKDGWAGGVTEIYLALKGLKIDYKWSDWGKPIIGQSCSLTIQNDASFYKLDDIMTLEEREFKILVDSSTAGGENIRLFNGWINSDVVSSKYLDKNIINITGSNYVDKLKNTHAPIVDKIQRTSMINVLGRTLALTGKDASIRINNTLDPSLSGVDWDVRTCFNVCGIDTENFWKNNEERDDGTKTIEKILTPLDSYLYIWDDVWYCERYADAWVNDGSMHYVEYVTTDASYGSSSNATNVRYNDVSTRLPVDCSTSDITFLGGSQTMSMIPGLQTLEIKADQKEYLNVTRNDFSEIENRALVPDVTYPDDREWNCYWTDDGPPTGWQFPGYKWDVLSPSIGYSYFKPTDVSDLSPAQLAVGPFPGNTYQSISNAIYRYGAPQYWSGGVYQYNNKDRASLSTAFRITVEDEGTTLKINWKFAPIAMNGGYDSWDYRCRYSIRATPAGHFLYHNLDDDIWQMESNVADASNWVEVLGANGDDFGDDGVAEVEVSIPISDVSGYADDVGWGDRKFVFNIMGEDIRQYDESEYRTFSAYPSFAYYGDVVISITGNKNANSFVTEINKNVLDEKKITYEIFDIDSLNYRNGIFTGSSFTTRTEYWTDRDALQYQNLIEWGLSDRWRLYFKNRRKFVADFNYAGFIKPMTMWYDDYDSSTRNYLLMSYTYYPGEDIYKGSWYEYDNTETINLNYE